MKKLFLLTVVAAASTFVVAQEVGRVISSTPIIQQVSVPRQICTTEQVAVQQPKSGAGAIMGAIAGGAMGNAVGGGSGRAAATVLGLFGGAVLGDRIEGDNPSQLQNVQRCGVQTFYENRPVAYNVVYEYAGKQYSVQMPNDPGPSIQLQVTPVGATSQMNDPPALEGYVQPMYEQRSPVYYSPPVNRSYYANPYYAPIGIELNYEYRDGYRRRRH